MSKLVHNVRAYTIAENKYERYYGPERRPLAYLLYYMLTVIPAYA